MEELEKELQPSAEAQTNTQTVNTEQTQSVQNISMPNIEQLRQNEMQFKTKTQLQGVTQVEDEFAQETREFTKKQDKAKQKAGVRSKVIKGVYFSVLGLLLTLVGVNAITLAVLSNSINTNKDTIKSKQDTIAEYVLNEGDIPDPLPITLNEPRDYNDDKKELTFWDKVTILFRNIFS